MPRARTGTLLPPGADGLWRCRITADRPDGTTWRPIYTLGTADKAHAQRKLARVNADLAAGRDPFEGLERESEQVTDYVDGWVKTREAQRVGTAKKERRVIEMHALEAIGRLPMCDVRPSHIRSILESAALKGLKRKTVSEVRGVLHRLFRTALEHEVIENNPVAAVRTPRIREVHKERCILTDGEFVKFVVCAEVDLELRMMALASRCEGGMRSGDLNRWDWSMIDRTGFAECIVPRAKTGTPQALAIPDVLAPFLRAWWERGGKPEAGPVFPARTGKRAGQARLPSSTFAKRLRRELFRAGIVRATPIEVPATGSGMRTDLGKQRKGTKLAPNPRDPLYFETANTLPVDFHSFRRAFSTALAQAGTNVQHAMHLAAHSDPRVHARYVMRTTAMRTVPAAALPALSALVLADRSQRDDSNAAHAMPAPLKTKNHRQHGGCDGNRHEP
jgi:integrase